MINGNNYAVYKSKAIHLIGLVIPNGTVYVPGWEHSIRTFSIFLLHRMKLKNAKLR